MAKAKIDPKAKGKRFELDVAAMLSKFTGQEFHRTPSSGGLRWHGNTQVISDIVPPPDYKWPISVECKCVEYPWEFDGIMRGKSMFVDHWKQCHTQAEREHLAPLLVFKKNRRNIYVAMWRDMWRCMLVRETGFADTTQFPYMILAGVDALEHDVVVLSMDTLMEHFTARHLAEAAENFIQFNP